MPHNITRPKLEAAVAEAAAAALQAAARDGAQPTGRTLANARALAEEVARDPRLAPALEPVSRFGSQTLRGVVIAAGAPLLVALGRALGVPVAESAAAEIVSTLVSLAGAAYAWYGRETTTRPLK
ncbi:MAG: hypothetical protein DI565_06125 [Ancylobacter novellus]|uniref:Holin n=1 Tax=Ancylobacter novellus TaxID=921 RepID=A0A2W5KM73_ANCNO|nr:MAG: hypothetical protein DI565_06125 [Ancylobacter novellus]